MALRARSSGSTTLSATVEAIGIVNQVADCLPIVSDVLKIVWRIAVLAEKIERQRQALRDLVVKSQSLGRSIRAVVADAVPSVLLAESLNSIYRVLDEIEQFMQKHLAKSRFMRFLAYALTMAGHIEQLKEDLANASMEFLLVACLDTNARVAALRLPIIERVIYADLPSARCIVKHHAVLSNPTYSVPPSFQARSFTISIIRQTIRGYVMAPGGAAVSVVSAYLNEMLREKRTPLAALEKRYGAMIFSGDDEKPLRRLSVLKLGPVLTSATAFIRTNAQITASNRIVLKAMAC